MAGNCQNKKPKQLNLKKIMIENARHADGGIYLVPSRRNLILLILILFLADFLVMYAGIEEIMYESVITCAAFAAVISIFFVAAPPLIVSTLAVKEKKMIHNISAGLLIIALIIMFICLGVWRMQSQTDIYNAAVTTSQGGSPGSTMAVLEHTAESIRNAEKGFKGLFITVLAGNSLLCMVITLMDAASVSRANHKVRKYAARLQEYIEQEEAAVQELEEALRQDLYKENEELYNQAVRELEVREEMINMKVKMMIAEYLAEPNAASQLYSENGEFSA